MKVLIGWMVIGMTLVSQLALAVDTAAGKAAYSGCIACHGAGAEGNTALKAPGLTHLSPAYIVSQLDKFRSGVRGGAGSEPPAVQMAAMANTLEDDQAVLDVARYIATLTEVARTSTVQGDTALGADYFNQMCGACHGPAAEGNPALNAPGLVGADDWYLLDQMMAFRAGKRGTHTDDKSGRQMRAMSAVLPSDQAVKDVVAFIQSLAGK